MLKEVNDITDFMREIEILKKRSELLGEILNYYKASTMTFDIPEKWKNKNVLPCKLPAESPRHLLYNKIRENLQSDEWYELIDRNL